MQEELTAAFDEAFAEASAEVIATWADYRTPLASRSKGTLRRDGDTGIVIDLPADGAGRAVIAAGENTGTVLRPFLDSVESTGTRVDDVMHYDRVRIRAFVVSSTDARQGWPSPRIVPTPDVDEVRARRRLWWL